ncbi:MULTISPECIES: hypothetical protein [unclassified Microcoleus]|uniref:hypothetical protein n=1 Tax=unclassified Microcoleus TaxID=2642155 RepID=UPI0025D94ED4|nr:MULTISPECIES: hypothetical protein [unclassified Microcoleus]
MSIIQLLASVDWRSPFWNKSKSAIALLVTNVFVGKGDRPSSIPDAKGSIALLELVKKCDRFWLFLAIWQGRFTLGIAPHARSCRWTGAIAMSGMERSIAFLDRGISLFGSRRGDRFSKEWSKLIVEKRVKGCVPRASKYDKLSKSTRLQDIQAMKLISLSAHFDGQSIQLDEPYKLEQNIKLIVTVLPEQLAEREAWLWLSRHQLNNAYSQDDDYAIDAIKTLNPDYAGS